MAKKIQCHPCLSGGSHGGTEKFKMFCDEKGVPCSSGYNFLTQRAQSFAKSQENTLPRRRGKIQSILAENNLCGALPTGRQACVLCVYFFYCKDRKERYTLRFAEMCRTRVAGMEALLEPEVARA